MIDQFETKMGYTMHICVCVWDKYILCVYVW